MSRRLTASPAGWLILVAIAAATVGAGMKGADPPSLWTGWATAVGVFHGAYLIYQLFGGLLAVVDRRWLVPHLVSLGWAITVVAMQWSCPLTSLEKALYARGGSRPYPGSFLDYYVFGRLLPDGSQEWVYGSYLMLVLLIYAWLWWRWSRIRATTLARA